MKRINVLKLVPIIAILVIVITFLLLLNMRSKINEKAKKELEDKKKSINDINTVIMSN